MERPSKTHEASPVGAQSVTCHEWLPPPRTHPHYEHILPATENALSDADASLKSSRLGDLRKHAPELYLTTAS
eukprot:6484055-Amphidinium_carterae.1